MDGEGGTWYQIKSGNVTGYIKSEYFITGADAERIAKDIGTVYVTVSADSLRLREQPSTDSAVLTTLSKDAEYLEVKEEGDFIEIQVDESLSGYVHKDYVTQRVEFKQAVSVEEERQKAEEDARIRKEAEDAIAKVEALKKEAGQETASANKDTPSSTIGMIAQNPNADNGTTKEQNSQGSLLEHPDRHKPEYRKSGYRQYRRTRRKRNFHRQQHRNLRLISEYPERSGKRKAEFRSPHRDRCICETVPWQSVCIRWDKLNERS